MNYLLDTIFRYSGFQKEMTLKEATRILAVSNAYPNASENYRRLILANHPDRGGSRYLAQKINEARKKLIS